MQVSSVQRHQQYPKQRESPVRILVIGGTGRVGSEVVKELRKRDADVRVLVRKPEQQSLPGVEVVVGDLLDPVSIEKALQGVDKLYLLNAVTPDELTQGRQSIFAT
jgi:uncharacterized protein YbjT (DUF2867 family)